MADHLPRLWRPLPEHSPNKCDQIFSRYRDAALQGEKLLDEEAERGTNTWFSPLELARLLLMRRIPRPLPSSGDLWRFSVLGADIPDLDTMLKKEA